MMAKALAEAGARQVYILGRRQQVLDHAAAEHTSLVPIVCDVTSKESLQAAVDVIARDMGHVNLLIANSGVLGPAALLDYDLPIGELRKRAFEGVAMEDFTQTLGVNVTGAYFTMLAFLELLDAGNKKALQGGFGAPLVSGSTVPSIQSQVIFTSSIGAYSRDRVSRPAYSGSKAALSHLAKHASTNLTKYEIRVNVLAPGRKYIITAHPPPNPRLVTARRMPTLMQIPSIPVRNCQRHDVQQRPRERGSRPPILYPLSAIRGY